MTEGGMNMTRTSLLRFTFTVIFSILFSASAYASGDYIGVWQREARFLNGTLAGSEPASLVITEAAFNSVVTAPPELACGFSASLSVSGSQMAVTVAASSCPSRTPVGAQITYTYNVAPGGNKLTLTHSTPEGQVKEVYNKTNHATGSGCSHPYCGTWLETGTFVAGEPVESEPATAVITDKTYWAVTSVCYAFADITSVVDTLVTLTMINHNCPTMPGFMPPGHVVPATWKLSENGQKLAITDTNYGTPVTTEFKRLQ